MLYVAIPLFKDGVIEGVARTSLPSLTLVETLKPVLMKFVIAGFLTAFIAILFSFMFSMFVIKPVRNILDGVELFSQGKLDEKLHVTGAYEFAKLSENMNQMATELKYRIDTITKQRNELARLENIRKEFVANVSHELRTPITSIKGYIETLRDGAIDERENALEFLAIISRQTERLSSIIEDLLCLSKIERENGSSSVEMVPHLISPVIFNAVSTVSRLASQMGVEIEVNCPERLSAKINPRLFEQAVLNLIDNAVKYSESGSKVEVSAQQSDSNITIKVKDYGCGIEKEHLDRLFERFYRVDKARSRKLGGTGLGLAIVKHIVQSHHGVVEVESTPGEGSAFSITIPKE
jgi:signal transduction histidine kinase